jgi:hypothetical protein
VSPVIAVAAAIAAVLIGVGLEFRKRARRRSPAPQGQPMAQDAVKSVSGPARPGTDFAYANARRKLDQQQRAFEDLNTRTGVLTGLLAVAIGGFAANAKTATERWVGSVLLAFAIGFAVVGYLSGSFEDAPDVEVVAGEATLAESAI